ncbi:DUF885 domain-containing protein [Pseudomaricurvus alkylphenolicus]|uniref:DUF885 domain-containing protein n=1 Tax=Pseudomaricurvus alkylphenolicus TaxID=1306991 RepID=UPI00141E4291|nr:DUF885 domain-containing protein [Pseudomaricurvus alkylphenolicus]NIB39883.1 DUF885 domain-containing protein [Pseudomaricurvus alkylphenolicus]
MPFLRSVLFSCLLLTGTGCSLNTSIATQEPATAAQALSPSEHANQLFDELFMEEVMLSPVYQTFLGIKTDQDKWDDISETGKERHQAMRLRHLKLIRNLDTSQFDEQTQLSYHLFLQNLENGIADYQWRHHTYPVNQMRGVHSLVPSLLINQHQIHDIKDAEDYIARLQAVPAYFDQLIDGLNLRADKGIIAPAFVFPHVIRDSRNIISGAPFDDGVDSTLLADFASKVAKLDIPSEHKKHLVLTTSDALLKQVGPAYKKLINAIEALQQRADTRDGAWKLPAGDAFYKNALQRTTTTTLSAAQIHTIGLEEVERIHGQMRDIMKAVNFKGDLQAFFEFMRTDKRFYKPESDIGKEEYLTEATALIDTMKLQLDAMFITKPKADLIVKAVEPFREKSAGKAFYQRPAPDGSRPGMYYANLYRMSDMPTYQMEALAYHEGIPGHHMQLAISQELQGIPKFRRFGGYTAYTEGWGLYSEYVPKEMGFYQDPYSDFGRLAMELWRACRLVVDTGIHHKRWTREQAIDYLAKNTPNPQGDVVKAIERYIVMPSQATAYKIGMLKILELRENARAQLGDKFDIRQFHDLVLKNGPLPLDVLEEQVSLWVKNTD